MNKKYSFNIFLLCLLLLISCIAQKETFEYGEYFLDNESIQSGLFINGKEHGVHIIKYINDTSRMIIKEYQNGTLLSRLSFSNHVLYNYQKFYQDSTISFSYYIDALNSKVITYNKDSSIFYVESYYWNGEIKAKGIYKNGPTRTDGVSSVSIFKIGEWQYLNENGGVDSIREYPQIEDK